MIHLLVLETILVGRLGHVAARGDRLAIRAMLKLEVVLGDEAEVIRADVFEGTYPAILLRKSANQLTCTDLKMAIGI